MDAKRFKRLIEPHLDGLFRAAFRLVRNRAAAEAFQATTDIRRPDGRVIPRFGYRLADMRDDSEPSAEVRETRGQYHAILVNHRAYMRS